jgi:splicing factor U2AF subunit
LFRNPYLDQPCASAHKNGTYTTNQVYSLSYYTLNLTESREARIQRYFDAIFEEIFCEVEDAYGDVDDVNICDNLGEHMMGNVYIKVRVWLHSDRLRLGAEQFRRCMDAVRACTALNERWFAGAPVYAELSPVVDFREASCRQYEIG